jgi:hypothetical protein
MSMNPEQDDFQQLRRLLALKRHEQPPPGYFHGFSGQVISRIRLGERQAKDSMADRLLWQIPWLERFWSALQAKPALAGAFGVLVCGLVISGAVYSEHTDSGQLAVLPASEPSTEPAQPVLASQLSPVGVSGMQVSSMAGMPNLPKTDSLFEEIRRTPQWRLQGDLQAQPVTERITIGQ